VIDAPAQRDAIPVTLVRRRNGYLSRAAQTLLEVLRAGGAHARPAAPARRRPRGRRNGEARRGCSRLPT